MITDNQDGSPDPPQIPDLLLRLLPPHHREQLIGDLTELYRDEVQPAVGTRKAAIWFRAEVFRCVAVDIAIRARGAVFGRASDGGRTVRSAKRGTRMESVWQDFAHALRALLKAPGFTVPAVLTLALGIGANTAIFTVVNGVLIRPLPYSNSERLVAAWETFRPRGIMEGAVSYPNLLEWQTTTNSFEQLAGAHPEAHTVTARGLPERVSGARVTFGFLPLLGVQPASGRLFVAADDAPGADNVAIVSDALWQRTFGADPFTGDETLTLDGVVFSIVGVMPAGFDCPLWIAGSEIWTPAAQDYVSFEHREWPRLMVLGRLADDVPVDAAQVEMDALADQLAVEFPETNQEHGINLVPLRRQVSASAVQLLSILLAGVAAVLLITCANVMNLLLTRGLGRAKEIAVRAALGASRGRVVRLFLSEGLVLALAGGVLGVALAWGGTRALVALAPPTFPRLSEISIDRWVLAFTLIVAVGTGFVAGIAPALVASRFDLQTALEGGGRTTSAGRARRLRSWLVVGQVAAAMVMLVSGGLLGRSFKKMMDSDPGFNATNVLTFMMSTGWSQMDVDRRAAFYTDAVEQLEALPGVLAAGAGTSLPLSGGFRATFQIVGRPEAPRGEAPVTRYLSVTPGYFGVLEIPLLSGRSFTPQDARNADGVVIVNQAAARKFWPGEDPIGRSIRPDVDITDSDPVEFRIVGMVGDVGDTGLDAEPAPIIYVPHSQQTWPNMAFALKTAGAPESLVGPVRELMFGLTHEATYRFTTLDTTLEPSVVDRRFPTVLVSLFAALALALASVGVFGLLSHSVSQRHHEIGIRMALGARASSVLRLVLTDGIRLLAFGVGIGLIASVPATRLLADMLFRVPATDVVTYTAAPLVLFAAGLIACVVPTRRATRVDPMVVIRAE